MNQRPKSEMVLTICSGRNLVGIHVHTDTEATLDHEKTWDDPRVFTVSAHLKELPSTGNNSRSSKHSGLT
jgi:hypothetical protein